MLGQRREIRILTNQVKVLIIVGIVVLIQSIAKDYLMEWWASNRDVVSCVPIDVETTMPHANIQSAAHPLNTEAKIQTFIKKYVRFTKTEQIIDFHKVFNDVEGKGRFDKARLSDSLLSAINMSRGPERDLNKYRYSMSTDRFFVLDRENMNIIFLIDEIITFPTPSKNIAVIVRGQYDLIYDQAEKKGKTTPPEFLGYWELRYLIDQDFPITDLSGEYENKWGMYVISSRETKIKPSDYLMLRKRSRSLFRKELGDGYIDTLKYKKTEEEIEKEREEGAKDE